MKDEVLKDGFICLAVSVIILALTNLLSVCDRAKLRNRIDKIESSYVTQERLDSTLIEIFD